MFTGLIQTTGVLQTLSSDNLRISWARTTPAYVFADLAIGDSVAVDGVCLTVTRILSDGFEVAVSPETLARTTITQASSKWVNLEPSLRVGSKLGGHFVTGHIDGLGYLQASTQTAIAWEMSFAVPDPKVARYIVSKGSIAINGISLTVAHCSETGDWFNVAVIPLTYSDTTLQQLQIGDPVNLEGDVLGKYVEKFMRMGSGQASALSETGDDAGVHDRGDRLPNAISAAFLAEHGYL